MSKIKLTKKGDSESFETFRLLIAFVLATAVLVIIISMINSTNKQSILISNQKLKEGVLSATKSVGTSTHIPFVIEDLMLSGDISKTAISNYSGMNRECIALVGGPQMENINNGEILRIKPKYLKMNVIAYCDFYTSHSSIPNELSIDGVQITGDYETCSTYCIFFFNK